MQDCHAHARIRDFRDSRLSTGRCGSSFVSQSTIGCAYFTLFVFVVSIAKITSFRNTSSNQNTVLTAKWKTKTYQEIANKQDGFKLLWLTISSHCNHNSYNTIRELLVVYGLSILDVQTLLQMEKVNKLWREILQQNYQREVGSRWSQSCSIQSRTEGLPL
jgi:putative protein kinase ArgK-like GTPase of G3E family